MASLLEKTAAGEPGAAAAGEEGAAAVHTCVVAMLLRISAGWEAVAMAAVNFPVFGASLLLITVAPRAWLRLRTPLLMAEALLGIGPTAALPTQLCLVMLASAANPDHWRSFQLACAAAEARGAADAPSKSAPFGMVAAALSRLVAAAPAGLPEEAAFQLTITRIQVGTRANAGSDREALCGGATLWALRTRELCHRLQFAEAEHRRFPGLQAATQAWQPAGSTMLLLLWAVMPVAVWKALVLAWPVL
eukprot:scaffold3.g6377.t1